MSITATDSSFSFQYSDHIADSIASDRQAGKAEGGKELKMFAEDEPSFWDLLDVINPLQHIPVISNIYRDLTGDQIGVGARLAGSTLFGGPIGLVASMVDCAIEEDTGKDMGGHMLALFQGDETAPEPGATQLAKAEPAAPVSPTTSVAAPPVTEMLGANAAFKPVLGETDALNAPSAGIMVFTADGAPAADAPAAPRPLQAAAQPVPLVGQPARFMPVPGRNPGVTAVNSPPPISIPVSNSGSRSNVPITGRDPVANAATPAAAQRALESTGHKTAAPAQLPGGNAANQDWFSSAMKNGLDKYEQAARLTRKGEAQPVPLQ